MLGAYSSDRPPPLNKASHSSLRDFFILPGQPYDYGGVKRQPRNITFGARSLVSKCLPVMYHLNQRTFESCPMPNVCLAGNELGHISGGTPRYSTPFGGDYVPILQSGKWPKP